MKPTKLGQPCWETERVGQVITNVAKMDVARVHDFLAAHAPVLDLQDEVLKQAVDEEQFFRALFSAQRDHTLAVVRGDPGTGKSHLIHWLKLRCEKALDDGELRNVVPVLVQRRGGSLKDALDQILTQLPQSYAHYLDPVRRAISEISQSTARETLASELRLELGPRWADRKRPPRGRRLKFIGELCASTGSRSYLCRPGGVIDRNVQRLSSTSTVEERESLPSFTAQEFQGLASAIQNNTPDVLNLIDELEDAPSLAEETADAFNLVLRDALANMSGLGGGTLRDIFDRIRIDLKTEGKSLALFIEDVSMLSALDKEVFHALEPQSRPELCPLVAVLGVTLAARFADNESQRITHKVLVGSGSLGWGKDEAALRKFVARYLNTVRLIPSESETVADQRRNGKELSTSACTNCPIRAECHARFGSVDFDGVPVGLFPLAEPTPRRLLDGLAAHDPHWATPRGLLDRVLRELLSAPTLESGRFPNKRALPVRLPEPHYWGLFRERYAHGYPSEQLLQLQFLAEGWVEAASVDECAKQLALLASAFGLRELKVELPSAERAKASKARPDPTPKPLPPLRPVTAQPPPASVEPELTRFLTAIGEWVGPEQKGLSVTHDTRAREWLLAFVEHSLPVLETPGLPFRTFKKLLPTKSGILIEGQSSKVGVQAGIEIRFERSNETADLLRALAHFNISGGRSWNFDDAEFHKRVVSRWLRRNAQRVLTRFQPAEGRQALVDAAVDALCLGALLRSRSKLPRAPAELVQRVVEPPAGPPPTAASGGGKWRTLLLNLNERQHLIHRFLLDQIGVPQGKGGGNNFIDPLPLLKAARAFLAHPRLSSLPSTYLQGHFKPIYSDAASVAPGEQSLAACFEDEREEVRSQVARIRDVIDRAGLPTNPLSKSARSYAEQLVALARALDGIGMSVGPRDFETFRAAFAAPNGWLGGVLSAERCLASEELEQWLVFDPAPLSQASVAFAAARQWIESVEREVTAAEAPLKAGGDPDELAAELRQTLSGIAAVAQAGETCEVKS